ncbi:hypothetical protein EVAR_100120_1, partial [Eumeta japonica]
MGTGSLVVPLKSDTDTARFACRALQEFHEYILEVFLLLFSFFQSLVGFQLRDTSLNPERLQLTQLVSRVNFKSSSAGNITPSVTITPAPPPAAQHGTSSKASSRSEDTHTPAQRQAAAKLALRKQLEKTLLQ